MSHRHCQACSNETYGVKTRKPVHHTCGSTDKERRERKEWQAKQEAAAQRVYDLYKQLFKEGLSADEITRRLKEYQESGLDR